MKKKIKRGDPYKKNFFFLKIIKNCLKVVFNQFDVVLEENFFLKFGKKITRIPVEYMDPVMLKNSNQFPKTYISPSITVQQTFSGYSSDFG